MGDMADMILDQYGFEDVDGWRESEPDDYLGETDGVLRELTAKARGEKIRSIRSSPGPLSTAQRYGLAKWIADADNRAMSRL